MRTARYLRYVFCVTIVLGTLAGCTAEKNVSFSATKSSPPTLQSPSLRPLHLGTIAVAKVNIEHPTAKLVFKESGVSDSIVRHLKQSQHFKVIDWTNLEDVLLRRNLHWSDLNQDKDVSRQIRGVLLNDYFIMGSITGYSERMEYTSTAFSKLKKQVVSVVVELTVKDAITNEIVATAAGSSEKTRQITQTLGFGAAGGNDTMMANQVLEAALNRGFAELSPRLQKYHLAKSADHRDNKPKSSLVQLSNDVKILFLFAEKQVDDKKDVEDTAGILDLSMAEQAMAKGFHARGAQVLTAGDIVNRAYSIAGGQNVLLGDWVTEEELTDLENLLQARSGLAAYAIKAGKAAGADIVISGTILFQNYDAQYTGKLKAKQSSVLFTAKAIRIKDKKILHISDFQQDYVAIQGASQLKARSGAIHLAAKRAVREIVNAIDEAY